jgi:hypothetical protein
MAAEIKITPELLASLVSAEVAKIMTAKTPDQRIAEAMSIQRGTNRPPREEMTVACKSPMTGATFNARLERLTDGTLGVTELLDYERPAGWDKTKQDGGRGNSAQLEKRPDNGEYTKKAIWLQHRAYYMLDAGTIGPNENGRRDLPAGWSADYDRARSDAPETVTISREEYEAMMALATKPEAAE